MDRAGILDKPPLPSLTTNRNTTAEHPEVQAYPLYFEDFAHF
jgi:hypothetical protein